MSAVSPIRRRPYDPKEEARAIAERDALVAGASEEVSQADIDTFFPPLEVPVFVNSVPRVRTDRVIKPTGLPPSDWSLL